MYTYIYKHRSTQMITISLQHNSGITGQMRIIQILIFPDITRKYLIYIIFQLFFNAFDMLRAIDHHVLEIVIKSDIMLYVLYQ
jgi:hypothetical protein